MRMRKAVRKIFINYYYNGKNMSGPQNNLFNKASLEFQIQSLNIKLKTLNKLLQHTNQTQPQQNSDFDRYFTALHTSLEQQNKLYLDLSTVLQNQNQIAHIKAIIENLKSQIQAHNLLIDDKQLCRADISKIRMKQKHNGQIKSLMSTLRKKKQIYQNVSSKYCEGVAKKLEDQVKKVLKVYNYTFTCADGYTQLLSIRDQEKIELQKAQKRLAQSKNKNGIEQFMKRLKQNQNDLQQKIDEINLLRLKQFSYNKEQIKNFIQQTETALQQATKNLNQIPKQKKQQINFQEVQSIINKIKYLKGKYCQQYEKYQQNGNNIWHKVYKYEQEVIYSTKMNKLLEEQIKKLEQYLNNFDEVRALLIMIMD